MKSSLIRRARVTGHAALAMLFAGSALAQSVDQTGTGGGPASTAKAPYTTATGATVPRPKTLDETEIIARKAKDGKTR